MRIKRFFNEEFKTFSNLDNVRSIPSVIDGFKDSQRKAVYGMIRHGSSEIKVAQLAGNSSLVTHYEHGEVSMADTIVGLAQDYPGSNNVNLFEPIGQFGSILSSEASAHRYIFTKPSRHLREYIRQEDDCILEHRYEDGDKVEPFNFFPVIPMWAVNGSIGIGTGHSVKILPRDPKNVRTVIKSIVNGKMPNPQRMSDLLRPSFVGWKGTVVETEEGKYELHGVIEKVNTTTLRVTELPVGYGVDKFKAILVDLMDKGSVKDYDNNSTESGFDFEIKVPRETGRKTEAELKRLLKLIARHSENMTMWDTDGKLCQYGSAYDALSDFIEFRIEKYDDRRLTQIGILDDGIDFLRNKKLFILNWNAIDNAGKMKTAELVDLMVKQGVKAEYIDRLMSLRISSLSYDQIEELEKDIKSKTDTMNNLMTTTAEQLYISELA